eukprot:7635010-Alexandrium_andersonii.AAC.1
MSDSDRVFPQSGVDINPDRRSVYDRVCQATRIDDQGRQMTRPPESGVPEFHHQDPRVEGEELYGQAVRKWLPELMFSRPDEGLFGKES